MNTDFFFKFAKFRFSSLVNAEDWADKLNYQWTSSFLVISTALIAMRQYIFTPIQCWVRPEWPRPWEEYTENYCWIQNTYHVAFMDPNHPEPQRRKEAELNYYQWVPFMLALEALLVYSPHVIWKILTLNSGFSPNAIVKFAQESATLDQDKKKKYVGYLARQIEKAMNSRRQWRTDRSRWLRIQNKCHSILPCFWFGKRSGTMLFALYVVNKFVYMGVAVLHLFVMKWFLGFDSLAFGFNCLRDIMAGREWQDTRVFPRVTFCDVPARGTAQWNTFSIQCVLPVNLLNEKIYIFLWFWTIICIAVSVFSLVLWMLRMLLMKNRQHFIKRYLRVLTEFVGSEDEEEVARRKRFVDEFLAYDGIFLLRMIACNVGDVCTAEVVADMYNAYDRDSSGSSSPIKRKASSVGQTHPSTVGLNENDMFMKKSQV